MMSENQDAVQLLNTAIVKSKERGINTSFESKLNTICHSPVMASLLVAIDHLAEKQNISRDHAAVQIVETIRDLDSIWNDYVLMEGIGKLKELLKDKIH